MANLDIGANFSNPNFHTSDDFGVRFFDANSFIRRTLGNFHTSSCSLNQKSSVLAGGHNFGNLTTGANRSYSKLRDIERKIAFIDKNVPPFVSCGMTVPNHDDLTTNDSNVTQDQYVSSSASKSDIDESTVHLLVSHHNVIAESSRTPIVETSQICDNVNFSVFSPTTESYCVDTTSTCRICQMPGEPLMSPCRCSGTMRFVHVACLVHWLEVSRKKLQPEPQCELCGYSFRTHHCIKLNRLLYPGCSYRDRLWHLIFIIMLMVMIGCVILGGMYLKASRPKYRTALTTEDLAVIVSSILFFCAFFVAVFTQYRAKTPVCRLAMRFWLMNRHWRVKNYDPQFDVENSLLNSSNKKCLDKSSSNNRNV